MHTCLDAKTIYGDDFTFDEIKQRYDREKEAYANIGNKNIETYFYGYHALNQLHRFKYLKGKKFENVPGLGAAWGHEFYPIVGSITNLHIIEPSDKLKSEKIGNIKPVYSVPAICGTIDNPDNYFDLVTSFGTLPILRNFRIVPGNQTRRPYPDPGADYLYG